LTPSQEGLSFIELDSIFSGVKQGALLQDVSDDFGENTVSIFSEKLL
jgi:hypothetical protein